MAFNFDIWNLVANEDDWFSIFMNDFHISLFHSVLFILHSQ